MLWKTCAIVRLRPHHLLCILTFAGEGYSPSFVANFAAIAARIGAGETIELVAGPDDICAPLEGTDDTHCHGASVTGRDDERGASSPPPYRTSPARAWCSTPARSPISRTLRGGHDTRRLRGLFVERALQRDRIRRLRLREVVIRPS